MDKLGSHQTLTDVSGVLFNPPPYLNTDDLANNNADNIHEVTAILTVRVCVMS